MSPARTEDDGTDAGSWDGPAPMVADRDVPSAVGEPLRVGGAGRATVLIVDDDPAQRALISKILATVGITQVEHAGDRDSFIAAVERCDPDLVTIDLHLGGGDAFDALTVIPRRDPDWGRRRVLLVTGDTNPAVTARARSVGVHRILHKPFAMDDLLRHITDLLDQHPAGGVPASGLIPARSVLSSDEPPANASVAMHLTDVVRCLADARSIEEIAAHVRSVARRLTGADGATFAVRDGDSCHYLDEDAISPLWKGQRFPIDICISGWTMQHRQIAVVPDVYADARIPHDVYRPTFVKSLVMVPVRTNDPLAAIGTYWSTPRTPTDDELRILQALADSTALALENLRLYRQLDTTRDRTSDLTTSNDQLRDFVHAVAHDIRSPLTTIHGLAELLVREPHTLTPDTVDAINHIRASALDLSDYVTDLLDFAIADGRAPEHTTITLSELVHDATGRLTHHITARNATITITIDADTDAAVTATDADAVVTTDADADADADAAVTATDADAAVTATDADAAVTADANAVVSGDRTLLTQILQNLIANALAYVPADRDPHIRIDLARTPSHQTITVTDNGNGVPAGEHETIFQPFRRGSNSHHTTGTGLGLALCQRAARRHGGDITVDNTPTGGARFTLTTPTPTPTHAVNHR